MIKHVLTSQTQKNKKLKKKKLKLQNQATQKKKKVLTFTKRSISINAFKKYFQNRPENHRS